MDETLWSIYRDESERDLLVKVRECMAAYQRKMGIAPNVVGVASSLSEEAQAILEREGTRVVRNLPAWAKSEIWVGRSSTDGGCDERQG
jgi:phage major head subunit gpT-like protein